MVDLSGDDEPSGLWPYRPALGAAPDNFRVGYARDVAIPQTTNQDLLPHRGSSAGMKPLTPALKKHCEGSFMIASGIDGGTQSRKTVARDVDSREPLDSSTSSS